VVCDRSCSECERCLRLYLWDADVWERISARRTWLDSHIALPNSSSSAALHNLSNVGWSGDWRVVPMAPHTISDRVDALAVWSFRKTVPHASGALQMSDDWLCKCAAECHHPVFMSVTHASHRCEKCASNTNMSPPSIYEKVTYNVEDVDIIAEEQEAEDEDWETGVKFYE